MGAWGWEAAGREALETAAAAGAARVAAAFLALI